MEQLIHIVRAYAEQAARRAAQPRVGVVSSVDPERSLARVRIQPEDVLSGWLPLVTLWLGQGWGLTCPPAPGDQVLVIWQEGDSENGVVIGRLPSARQVPGKVDVGEFCIRHKSGAQIRLRNDGNIVSNAPTWFHTGDLVVSGSVSDSHGSLASLRTHYNEHSHPPDDSHPVPLD